MKINEVAVLLGRSPSTIYRWLRRGRRDIFAKAGLSISKEGRYWVISKAITPAKESATSAWPGYIHRGFAEKAGLTPEDFRFDQWPVSNVQLMHVPPPPSDGPSEYSARYMGALYKCSIPAATPQANQYVKDPAEKSGYRSLPDPVGMCLSRVKFILRDADTHEDLDESNTGHIQGDVVGHLTAGQDPHPAARRIPLWQRLTPENPVRVYLLAYPLFMYLSADGAVHAEYANLHNGYFGGAEVESLRYTLSLDFDGNLFIDGQPRPKPPPPPVELPGDYNEGESFGAYIARKRQAKGLSPFQLGSTISQPWQNKDGTQTYDPDLWIHWLENDQAQLFIEWEGRMQLNTTQVYGLADALSLEGRHLNNLAEYLLAA